MSRILVAQLNMTIGAFASNGKKILGVLDEARQKKADIVLFAELATCGYPPEDLLLHESFIDGSEKLLAEIVQASHGLFVVVGLVRRNRDALQKPLYNSAAVISDGKLLGFHDKILLPTYDVFDERRYFEPGVVAKTWEHRGKKIAVLICEDVWGHKGHYRTDPVTELIHESPDLLLNLSASPFQFQKPGARLEVCQRTARLLKCPMVMCCQVGGNDQIVFDGYSSCVDKTGELVALASGFREEQMVIDLGKLPEPLSFNEDPISDLYEALVLGTRDYFHKQGFTKGCLGLSGGIDSALVACIAKEALGSSNLLGVAMPSRYSSSSSLIDAKLLAERLGIAYEEIKIETIFADYLHLLGPHFKGRAFDVTEENLQARIRGTILMALSNKWGSILLSTGNKSELALGYCTLYGDMAGGLGVLADVTKRQVYALARFINRNEEVIPRSTIEKPPSAELRLDQKDSDSLPPYEEIDAVVEGYVEECLPREEIARKYKLPLSLVNDLVAKIHRAEYKRRQAPPGIRVSKKSFRVGRNYPIVQKWH